MNGPNYPKTKDHPDQYAVRWYLQAAYNPAATNRSGGAIAAPFMLSNGIVRWLAGGDRPAVRIEPNGSQQRLPHASTLPAPEIGGVVLVSSGSTERIFGDPLRDAGYRVIKYKSAVAAALCAMDPTLFKRLHPNESGNDPIVGVVMRAAKNWDVAGAIAIANRLGHFVSDTQGRPRTFEDGANSAIFAASGIIGRMLVNTVAPHLHK